MNLKSKLMSFLCYDVFLSGVQQFCYVKSIMLYYLYDCKNCLLFNCIVTRFT